MSDRKRVRWNYNDPGIASQFINDLSKLSGDDDVFLACRVSGYVQQRRKVLEESERFLRREMAKFAVRVKGVLKHCGPGYDPYWLNPLVCQVLREGGIILAETTCRFIRNERFHSRDRPRIQPTKSDLLKLQMETENVQLMTFLHPDATPSEIKSFQAKKGQREKGNKGGHPPMPEQTKLMNTAWKLFRQLPR